MILAGHRILQEIPTPKSVHPYIDELKRFAMYQGFPEDAVDQLIEDGFTLEEVEEYLYECG